MKRCVVLIVAIFIFGCKPELNTNLKLKTDLPEAADKLEKALAAVDPVGLKKLVDENQELRLKLAALQGTLSGVAYGDAVVVLEGSRLRIEIVQYTGAQKINGWVDSRENWFWHNRKFVDMTITLPIDYGAVIESVVTDIASQLTSNPTPFQWSSIEKRKLALNLLGKNLKKIADKYESEVTSQFGAYLKTSALIPRPDERFIDLKPQLFSSGDHTVSIELTPISKNSGRWSMRGRIIALSPNGNETRIKEFDLDSDDFPDHELGKPLVPLYALIRVRAAD